MDLIPEGYAIVPLGPECVEVPHGMVCYSGLLPGATAVYTGREEYTLHGNDSRMCGEDRVWSGAVPQCDTDTNTTVTHTIQSHISGEVMTYITAYGCRCIKSVSLTFQLHNVKFLMQVQLARMFVRV